VGYLHALETFSQLISKDNNNNYFISYLPIEIEDAPAFAHRGIMIDTARHFLSKVAIKRTIDAMSYNKLNVLHWHITDDESFPIELQSFPEITKTGAYSSDEIFSSADVHEIVKYATEKGIRIIPEIDSPGHCRSWGQSDTLKDMVI